MKDDEMLAHFLATLAALMAEVAPFADNGMPAAEVRHLLARLDGVAAILECFRQEARDS